MYNALICIFFIIITLLFSKIPKEPFVQAETVNQRTSVSTITYFSRIVSINRIQIRKNIFDNSRTVEIKKKTIRDKAAAEDGLVKRKDTIYIIYIMHLLSLGRIANSREFRLVANNHE